MASSKEYYDFLSKYWNKMYNDIVPYDDVFDLIEGFRQEIGLEKNILDVACGTGLLLDKFSSDNYKCTGGDINPRMIEEAKNLLGSDNLHQADYRNFDYPKKHDIIVSFFNSFAYLKNNNELFSTLNHLYDYLKKDGILVFDIYTKENPEEIYLVQDYNFEEEYISRTFRGIPDYGLFRSTIIYTVLHKNNQDYSIHETKTTRGIFSTQDVVNTIDHTSFEIIYQDDYPLHETFIVQK